MAECLRSHEYYWLTENHEMKMKQAEASLALTETADRTTTNEEKNSNMCASEDWQNKKLPN